MIGQRFTYKPYRINLANGTTTVTPRPGVLKAVYVNTVLSAHTVAIKNGGSEIFTIEASLAAGQKKDFEDTEFDTNIIVEPNASSTGSITLLYRELV